MLAACRDDYGTADNIVVREMPKPEIAAKEVLVKVHATTVNRTDCGVLTGRPFVFRFFTGLPKPRSPILGTDFAGVVEKIGSAVTNVQVGDRVMGFCDNGLPSQAEFLAVGPNIAVAKIPDGVEFVTAAASLEGAHYAINFMRKPKIERGQKILVIGGTGAIGSAMIQLLKQEGCHVTAVTKKRDFEKVKALGADVLIDYETEKFDVVLKGKTFAHVFDAVGKSAFGVCKPLIAPTGVYSSSELGPNNENPFLALTTKFSRGPTVIFPIPLNIPETLRRMAGMLERGAFRPLIDREYQLKDIADAYRYAASGEKIGNLIVRIR
jgi:NADPH:quinone reductase-like Zn-dependent oxidoreductase